MDEKITTEQFLQTYADNLLKGLIEGAISFKYLSIDCQFCPLLEQCEKEAESCPDKIETCEEFYQRKLSDGLAFRKR